MSNDNLFSIGTFLAAFAYGVYSHLRVTRIHNEIRQRKPTTFVIHITVDPQSNEQPVIQIYKAGEKVE